MFFHSFENSRAIYRKLSLILLLVCWGLVAAAIIISKIDHLDPCPLCIFQRIAFILTGLVALSGFIYPPHSVLVRRINTALALLFSLTGLGIALWHVYLQYAPPRLTCGPDLAYMVANWSLAKWLPAVFRGTGECTRIDWEMFGLSMPIWSAVCFSAIAVGLIVYLIHSFRPQSSSYSF